MEWHFAEEIEHKAASFLVLREVSPAYPVRLAGFLLTASLFYLLLGLGAASFLVQDRLLHHPATWRQAWRHLGPAHHMLLRSLRHLLRYLRPRFQPDQLDDRHLAAAVIARQQRAAPPMVTPLRAATVAPEPSAHTA